MNSGLDTRDIVGRDKEFLVGLDGFALRDKFARGADVSYAGAVENLAAWNVISAFWYGDFTHD